MKTINVRLNDEDYWLLQKLKAELKAKTNAELVAKLLKIAINNKSEVKK